MMSFTNQEARAMTRNHRKPSHTFLPIIRAAGIVAAVMVVVSGVTFATLQSQQVKLTGNTIQTATANLQISPDGIAYSGSQQGFAFSNLVPVSYTHLRAHETG